MLLTLFIVGLFLLLVGISYSIHTTKEENREDQRLAKERSKRYFDDNYAEFVEGEWID